MTWRTVWLVLVVAGGVIGVTPRGSAEGLLDIYVGGAFTEASANGSPAAGTAATAQRSSDSWEFGVRGGYWFSGRANWLGFAGDLSYFSASQDSTRLWFIGAPVQFDSVSINVLAATPLLMLRLPLFADQTFEGGRLQPYVAIGPGLFTSFVSRNFVTNNNTFDSETEFEVGVDVRAGAAVLLIRHLGLFIEYRYTNYDMPIRDARGSGITSTLSTNHINGGLALRF